MERAVKLHLNLFHLPHALYTLYDADSAVMFAAWKALGNCRLALATDEDELPNTPEHRFLRAFGACLYVRKDLPAHPSYGLLEDLARECGMSWFADGDYGVSFDDVWNFYQAWLGNGECLSAEEYFR